MENLEPFSSVQDEVDPEEGELKNDKPSDVVSGTISDVVPSVADDGYVHIATDTEVG